jgi:ketosteroid isomerase-like protein
MSHANEQLIEQFYAAFARRDAEAMVACYADDVWFSDPAFGDLRGARAGDMWRMLIGRGANTEITWSGVSADDRTGRAHWEARYDFTLTGRRVHNVIDARFELRDGKIVRHADSFNFWRWAGMALGAKGTLLGWTPLVRNAVRRTALKSLAAYRPERA